MPRFSGDPIRAESNKQYKPIRIRYRYGNSYFYPTPMSDTSFINIDNPSHMTYGVGSPTSQLVGASAQPGSPNVNYQVSQTFFYQSSDGESCFDYGLFYTESGTAATISCAILDDESTAFVGQALADPVGAPTAGDFLQTLVTAGNDDGNVIREANSANGSDSCSFDLTVPPFTSVSNTAWTVGQLTPGYAEAQVVIPGHNQWGPDAVGFGPTAVRYFQVNRPKLGLSIPCGNSLHQNLEIECVQNGTKQTYKANNPLSSTIDATGITNCRSNICSRFTYPSCIWCSTCMCCGFRDCCSG
jgi:hypothetical protein